MLWEREKECKEESEQFMDVYSCKYECDCEKNKETWPQILSDSIKAKEKQFDHLPKF